MKNYLILLLVLLALGTYAQTPIKAVTDEPATLVLPKATRKTPIPITIGDSITLYKYTSSTQRWDAAYKGFKGTLIDSLLERSNRVTAFKNIFLDREYKASLIKRFGALYAKDILNGTIRMGMPAKAVVLVYGDPDDINRTVGSWGVHEQWVYEKDNKSEYLYFENGKLTSWQD